MNLEEIRKQILDCELCFPISKKYITLPHGNADNPIFMIVGESPSKNINLPRVRDTLQITPSGQMIRDTLNRINVNLSECYFTNIVKCTTAYTMGIPARCIATYLINELNSVNSRCIITLGKIAKDAINNINKSNLVVFHLPHPSAALRYPKLMNAYNRQVIDIINRGKDDF